MKVTSARGIYRAFLIEAGWHPDGADGAVQTVENWTSSGEAAAAGHTWARPPDSEAAEWIGAQGQPPADKPPKTTKARAGRRK